MVGLSTVAYKKSGVFTEGTGILSKSYKVIRKRLPVADQPEQADRKGGRCGTYRE